mmetsp:Transcript_3480/g.5255  ORF Transcript_3480/g.5255 Transcript_3480/m.5255 type:complete len:318 (+) Transcript_3480:59-1012(+)|eukprot:CAMPEP_0197232414 /NCGR_PEP_ID=MMETSP1429-20130617/614_1 /TAXON_ID=49237 /ORGANISM="Chaetoceros  sp., Strain UNC1202" /LENGTH=317 /DNA_ID=CAMNT_0042690421 /DNA_START=44 /DNA_END=997 /DNA_ORIENTATION=-
MSFIFAQEDIDKVSALHNPHYEPTEAETEQSTETLLIIFIACASIATFQNLVIGVLKATHYRKHRSYQQNKINRSATDTNTGTTTNTTNQLPSFMKTAYRITNLAVNLVLGIYGFYHYLSSLPHLSSTPITDRIASYTEFSKFGSLQVGYNIYSLFIGILFMNEPPAMIVHHIAVLIVGSLSSLCRNGFRYHAPFFFGAIEISSVPLAIMNMCKDHPEWTQKRYPRVCKWIRPAFAVVFLVVRVVLWLPQIADVLYISGLLGYTCQTNGCRVAVGMFWWSALFLTLLQLYWASLILKGLTKAFSGGGGGGSEKTKVD